MYVAVPAVLRASTLFQALRADFSTDPKVLFTYLLLLVVPWVLWEGHRSGASDDLPAEEDGPEEGDDPPPRSRRPGQESREKRARKRRQGHMDWIQ